MTLGLVFWILMLLWLIFGLFNWYSPNRVPFGYWGHGVFLFILFLILGWHDFGAPIHP